MDRTARLIPRRHLIVASGVVVSHAAMLWALHTGLLRQAVELVVPVAMMSDVIAPPAPKAEPQPQPPQPVVKRVPAPPTPRPVARPDPAPSPQAISVPAGPVTPAPVAVAAAPAPAPLAAPAPAPEPPKVQLPSTDADYLQNPKPVYPPASKRLGEQGQVILRVLIGADGHAQDAQVRTSSGFDRLDQAALQTVLKWRYVPGRRGGVPEAMWFNVPIHFVLE